MAQARPGAPPPLEHPSNRPPTACGSYKRRDQTMIAGETRPAELETPVKGFGGEMPPWSVLSYRPRGRGQQTRRAWFNLNIIPNPRAWLEDRLGLLVGHLLL